MDHKEVYEYEIGGEKFYADPFIVDYQYRRALRDSGLSNEDIDKCHDILCDPKSTMLPWYEALGKISVGICAAFNVQMHNPKTNEGLTLAQLYNLMFDFFRWQNDVKKNTETSLNGSLYTGTLPSDQTAESSGNTDSIGNSFTEQASTTEEIDWSQSHPFGKGF